MKWHIKNYKKSTQKFDIYYIYYIIILTMIIQTRTAFSGDSSSPLIAKVTGIGKQKIKTKLMYTIIVSTRTSLY
jgi:hypothetical protein